MPSSSRTHSIRQVRRLLQSKRVRPTTVVLAMFFLIPMAALAQGSPFDTGFTAIQSLFTGTIAKVASLVAIVIGGYRERLFKFVEAQSVELSFSERIAPAKGLSHGGKITLLSGMQPAEEFSTLTHEIAHEMLHRGTRRTLTTKQVRETEAEAVAFVVCQAIGLATGTASADYIQLWHGDADLLRESLEAVQQTAAVILGGIAPEPAAVAA